jgi:hypothetical protein
MMFNPEGRADGMFAGIPVPAKILLSGRMEQGPLHV